MQRKPSLEEGAGSWPFDAKPSSPPLQRVPLPAPHAAAAEQQRARRQQQAGLALNPAALNPAAAEPSPKPFGSLLSEAQLERISAESAALQGGDPAAAGSAAAVHADANVAAFPYAPLPSPPQQQDEETVQVRVSVRTSLLLAFMHIGDTRRTAADERCLMHLPAACSYVSCEHPYVRSNVAPAMACWPVVR